MNYSKRIAIWAEPRTGSTYYTDCVKRYFQANGHTDSDMFIQKERIDDVIDDFLMAYESGHAMVMRNHLEHYYIWQDLGLADLISEFHNVFMYRRNMFDQVISNWIGTHTQIWNTGDSNLVNRLEQNTYNIPHKEFIHLLELRWRELNANYRAINYAKHIAYEDLAFNYDTDIRLLNIPVHGSITTPVRSKQLPDKKQQVINYNELQLLYMEYQLESSDDFYLDDSGMLYLKEREI